MIKKYYKKIVLKQVIYCKINACFFIFFVCNFASEYINFRYKSGQNVKNQTRLKKLLLNNIIINAKNKNKEIFQPDWNKKIKKEVKFDCNQTS